MKKTSILVVDDEPLNFDVIEALLDDEDFDLHYASDGQQALDCLPIFNPDLILLDVMMPGMDGIEACRRIKNSSEWQAIPIVMVTALTEKQDLARCLNEGANDFLSKPVNPLELRARVFSMLRIKRQYDRIKCLSQSQAATIELLRNSLNELRSNVAASLPHELNTSLNGISGIIELLLTQRMGLTDDDVEEYLNLAQQSAHRLEKLIHRFLVYLELEVVTHEPDSAKHPLEPTSLESRSFIEYCARQHAEMCERSNDLVCILADGTVKAHPMDLKFIVDELLENAFKFSEPGNRVIVSSVTEGKHLLLTIEDRGRGMTKQQLDKIGAFMQFERSYYEQQGIGLGLEIVKKLALTHAWEFAVTSAYHQGTAATLRLPLLG